MVDEIAGYMAPFVRDHGDDLDGLHLLGTSGTVTTVAGVHLDLPRYDRRLVDGLWMDKPDVSRTIDRLRCMTYRQRVENGCIGTERADLVLAGCAIFDAIRQAFRLPAGLHRRSGPARRHAGADDARGCGSLICRAVPSFRQVLTT